MDPFMASQFQAVGAELCRRGLVSSHGGNLSVRVGDRMLVRSHGCKLGRIALEDLVETGLAPGDPADALASMEVAVHRAIYCFTAARAVVHAHPAHAIALSFKTRQITPVDIEGSAILGPVPVVGWGERFGPGQGAEAIARALIGCKAVMVHGHGCFAAGAGLEEACDYSLVLEESCRIQYLVRNMPP